MLTKSADGLIHAGEDFIKTLQLQGAYIVGFIIISIRQ